MQQASCAKKHTFLNGRCWRKRGHVILKVNRAHPLGTMSGLNRLHSNPAVLLLKNINVLARERHTKKVLQKEVHTLGSISEHSVQHDSRHEFWYLFYTHAGRVQGRTAVFRDHPIRTMKIHSKHTKTQSQQPKPRLLNSRETTDS